MKYISVIIIFLFAASYLYSYDIKITDYNLGIHGIYDMKTNGDIIVLLCRKEITLGPYDKAAIKVFDGESWTELPSVVYTGETTYHTLGYNLNSTINIDSSGNIWLSSQHLHRCIDTNWTTYKIFDEYRPYRSFGMSLVDKNNDIWLTSKIYHKPDEHDPADVNKSEILKFDGENFHKIFETNVACSFERRTENTFCTKVDLTRDNKFVIHRTFSAGLDEDFVEGGKNPELYFFDSNGNYERINLLTQCQFNFNFINVVPTTLYFDSKENLWVGLAVRSFIHPESGVWSSCCSGLSMLSNDGEWLLFDESSGLDEIDKYDSVYRPILKIKEIDESKYLVVGLTKIYEMGNDFVLRELDWKYILNNSFYIKGYDWDKDKVNKYLDRLIGESNFLPPPQVGEIIETKDGEIWIQLEHGIIVFNKSILSVADVESEKETIIYPNPAREFINVAAGDNYERYEIINLLGQIVAKGENSGALINIRKLPAGRYYLKLYNYRDIPEIFSFIKN